jgi:hypothetical protein
MRMRPIVTTAEFALAIENVKQNMISLLFVPG